MKNFPSSPPSKLLLLNIPLIKFSKLYKDISNETDINVGIESRV